MLPLESILAMKNHMWEENKEIEDPQILVKWPQVMYYKSPHAYCVGTITFCTDIIIQSHLGPPPYILTLLK